MISNYANINYASFAGKLHFDLTIKVAQSSLKLHTL